jgi:hypothetical protein
MQAVAPPPSAHLAARVFIHDDHLVLLHHVLHVLLKEAVRPQQVRDIVDALALPVAPRLELVFFLDLLRLV